MWIGYSHFGASSLFLCKQVKVAFGGCGEEFWASGDTCNGEASNGGA